MEETARIREILDYYREQKDRSDQSVIGEMLRELQKIRGSQLEELLEEYGRLEQEAGEHVARPADLAKRLYELEREYERNTRYA